MHGMFYKVLKHYPLECRKHCSNAEEMVKYLLGHESVAWVSHPSVPDHPDHELAKKLLPNGTWFNDCIWY